jgi:hypothetical protein
MKTAYVTPPMARLAMACFRTQSRFVFRPQLLKHV